MPIRWPWSRREDAAPAPLPVAVALSAPTPAAPAQPERRQRQPRADWANQATGMGIAGVDPALATYYLATTGISDEDAVDLHRTDPIAKKFINKPVDDAFSKGFELTIAEDDTARDTKGNRAGVDQRPAEQLKKDVKAKWKALKVFKVVRKAWKWERREGGAAILLGCVDVGAAAGMAAPLAPEGLVNLKWLEAIRARDLWPATYYEDPSAEKFGEVETWNVTRGKNGRGTVTLRVHESRLIIFEGEKVVDEAYRGQLHAGLGDSVLLPFFRALRRYGTSMAGIEKLLSRFGQPWMKMAKLAELMGPDKDGLLNATLDAYEYAASVFNIRVLDGEDSYGTDAPSVTGLPELVNLVRSELQAASDMPLPLLFGDVVGGLGDNATSVVRGWLDTVASLRDEHAIPPLTRITELIIRGLGKGNLPGEWEIKGCQLWHPTAKEQADVDEAESRIDTAYLAGTVVTPMQVARRKAVADRYAIDVSQLDDLEDAAAEMPDDIREPMSTLPAGDPNAPPAPGAPSPTGVDVQKTALNGAQVASLMGVIKDVVAGLVPREAAVQAIILAFQVDQPTAIALLGPEDWKSEPAPAGMPGGDAPTGMAGMQNGSGSGFTVGDSVKVRPGKEHMPEHAGKTMTIAEAKGDTYAVKIDGQVHRWYTGDELVAAGAMEPKP